MASAPRSGSGHGVTEMVYPLSADYVGGWTVERAVAELVANAVDEDPKAKMLWADGTLTIVDRGPGLTSGSLVIGHSPKGDEHIGQFGEGVKLSMLVLAREGIKMNIVTRGATLTPRIEQRAFALEGDDCAVLVVSIEPNRKRSGTTVTVDCGRDVFDDMNDRFLQLANRRYRPPVEPGRVMADRPGEIRVGGVLICRRDELVAGYDFSTASAKALLNRDRTVIDSWELRDLIGRVTARCDSPDACVLLASAALQGQLDSVERVRSPWSPEAVRAWKVARRRMFGAQRCCWSVSGDDAVARDRRERGWTVLVQTGDADVFAAVMDALGIPAAQHASSGTSRTVWVGRARLDADERKALSGVLRHARRVWGPDCVSTVRVFESTDEGDFEGFYDPNSETIAVKRDVLSDNDQLRRVVAHEIAHRWAHQRGWEWQDRTRGFEDALTHLAATALTPRTRRRQ